MLTSTPKKGLLALASAALLFSAATAQSGGGNPEVKRDPFINNQAAPPAIRQTTRPSDRGPQPFTNPKQQTIPAVKPADQPKIVLVVPAPDVTVSGIVASSGQRQAIINTSNGSRIVTVGQRLADYRVKAIGSDSVTFEAQGKSFKIPLGQES